MNALGIALTWCVLQVTLIGLLAAGLYLAVRRRWTAAAVPVVLTALAIVVVLSLMMMSPWPRWSAQESTSGDWDSPELSGPGCPRTHETGASLHSGPDPTPGAPLTGEAAPSQPPPSDPVVFWRALIDELQRPRSNVQEEAGWSWPAVVAALLLAAMVLGLGRLILGILVVRKERLRGRPIRDDGLLEVVNELRAALGCHRTVELRECDSLATAATIGWRRPVLLLPRDWAGWTAAERRAVLAHELVHVRSRDCLGMLLGQLGLALHFYGSSD